MFNEFIQLFRELFLSLNFSPSQASMLSEGTAFVSLLLLAGVAYYVAWFILKRTVISLIRRCSEPLQEGVTEPTNQKRSLLRF